MYNPHNRLIAPLALNVLAGRQICGVWHSPSEIDVFGVGYHPRKLESCCVAFFSVVYPEAAEDLVSADVTCGTAVRPVVTLSVERSALNVISTSLVFLQMRDAFGSLARSVFILDHEFPLFELWVLKWR